MAKATARGLHWGLTRVAHRTGGSLPGKTALRIDPQAIAHARGVLRRGSIVVAGTNGKTTCTNLLADTLEQAGFSVCCNRTGANLAFGVASTLLGCRGADWGVLESDELWLGRTLPALQPTYLVLLNLFRDQLDRCGEIDHIQNVIVRALEESPRTVLVYNADDPLCAMVARRAAEAPARQGVRSVAFGLTEPLNLEQNAVSDTTMCQVCSAMMDYDFRQYGQLGAYRCPSCGFARPALDVAADDVDFAPDGLAFRVTARSSGQASVGTRSAGPHRAVFGEEASRGISSSEERGNGDAGAAADGCPEPEGESFGLHSHLVGSYMVYNLLAVAAAALCVDGVKPQNVQRAIDAFDPQNGRLQRFTVGQHDVLLNLAKNPTGFNQNLRIVVQQATAAVHGTADGAHPLDAADSAAPLPADAPEREGGACAIAFFINDNNVDGNDISWIWDIDFEELHRLPRARVFAGGVRRNDLQVRLRYAGIEAQLIDGMADVLAAGAAGGFPADAAVYAIANYTALAPVRAELERLQDPSALAAAIADATIPQPTVPLPRPMSAEGSCTTEPPSETNPQTPSDADRTADQTPTPTAGESTAAPVVIAHMFPDLLNLYGDGGNVRILEQRLRWRGIPVEVRRVEHGQTIDFADADLVFLGGGPDREQALAAEQLMSMRDQLAAYAEDGGPILAICGGYQILGNTWLAADGEAPGLGILDIETHRAGDATDRLIDDIALESPLAEHPVVGYENHASRTYLGAGVKPFGRVVSRTGHGNNDTDHADGAVQGNVLGTYLHGTLLAKNPEVADWLLERALARHALRTGSDTPAPEPLNDAVELAANAALMQRLR